jgi:two-component system, response regulator
VWVWLAGKTQEIGMAGLAPILLVDDDIDVVYLALRAFEQSRFAHQIHVARDGIVALDYLYRRGQNAWRPVGPPLAVLLDIHMPRLDGIEVLRTIKGDEQFRRLPVIMLTSAPTDPNLPICYELGAAAYIVKPVEPAGFLNVIIALGLSWQILKPTPDTAVPPR